MEYNANDMMTILSEYGYQEFLIKILSSDEKLNYQMDFEIYEANAWSCDKNRTPVNLELYMRGLIKWDGCSHVWFGEEENGRSSGYLHLCGKTQWSKHAELMLKIYELAEKMITGYHAEIAD